jgi:hypothetical protein
MIELAKALYGPNVTVVGPKITAVPCRHHEVLHTHTNKLRPLYAGTMDDMRVVGYVATCTCGRTYFKEVTL